MLVMLRSLPRPKRRVVGGSESSSFRRAIKSGTDGRAHYQDGELVPYKPGLGIDPKPAAANDGTIINVRPAIPLTPSHSLSYHFLFCHLPRPYPPPLISYDPVKLTYRRKTYSTTCHSVNELSNHLRTNITGFLML